MNDLVAKSGSRIGRQDLPRQAGRGSKRLCHSAWRDFVNPSLTHISSGKQSRKSDGNFYAL
jgi:hypothetical protein